MFGFFSALNTGWTLQPNGSAYSFKYPSGRFFTTSGSFFQPVFLTT
jgi:hypothetical protein